MKYLNDAGGRYKLALKDDHGKTVCTLLWGDPLHELAREGSGAAERVKVRARKRVGWLPASAVGDTGLLEIYVIDVGQGDGVLMRTPHDDAWHLIDAGIRAAAQMTQKGAANFVRWKFIDDLRRERIALRNMIVTHPDADHYGGMIDLLSGVLPDGRTFGIDVDRFWHCGIGRFKDGDKLGAVRADAAAPLPHAGFGIKPVGRFIVELLDGKTHFARPKRAFAGDFAALARLVGKLPKKVSSLSQGDGWLSGYAPADGAASIRVLGPVREKLAGGAEGEKGGLRWLGSESVTRNGHSVVLRVDYGAARVLLTGDLNTASQRLLLSCHAADEFGADVAKGCHHGSDDIDLRFVRAMAARATVVSSGDNEDYAHPRPRILGASARYGRESRNCDGETMPPLLYSTELARSVGLQFASHARTVAEPKQPFAPQQLEVDFTASPTGRYRRLSWLPMATDLVYGLVNVRSDGQRILCATMQEASSDFDLQVFDAGVDPQ